jgi:hypothetical protein
MTNLTPELLEKILAPHFQTGGVAPSHGAPADPKKPGVYHVDTNLTNKPPQLALHVAKSNRKATVVLSPFAAEDPAKASRMDRYAKRCVQDSLLKNEAPVANHYFYHEVLNSNLSIDRDIGLQSQLTWIKHADLVAVYIDMGITQAMELAINVAKLSNRSLEFRKIGAVS